MTWAGLVIAMTIPFFLPATFNQQATGQSQQPRDSRPRVFVETGPSSDLTSESDLQDQRNSFGESMPNFCPRIIITEDRRKANFVIRLSVRGTYEPSILYSMAVFDRDGDQIFADAASQRPNTPVGGIKNPLIRFVKEACAVIVYGMDSGTVSSIILQAERREVRVYSRVNIEGVTNEKTLRGLANLSGLAFSLACFCTARTDDSGSADYVLQVNTPKGKPDMVEIFDGTGQRIFSESSSPSQVNSVKQLFSGACEAILAREH